MGGIVCAIHRRAVLRYASVPTGAADLKKFDKQLRKLINVVPIAAAIAEDEVRARKVCEVLAKTSWDPNERAFLFYSVKQAYE